MGKVQEFLKKISIKEQIKQGIEGYYTSKEGMNLLHEIQKKRFGTWKSKFIADVYQERILYPHEEMLSAKKGYLYNAFIHAAVDSLALFLLGGEMKISSKDKTTEKILNQEFRATGLKSIAQTHIFEDNIVTGNFYTERMFQGGQIVAYDYLPESERIYHDLDDKGLIKRFVLELPDEQLTGQFATLKYYGDRRKTIKGKELQKNKIFHIKSGTASISSYGRGAVCSIINDLEILLEIERAMAVIARYKAIPKKIIMPKDRSFSGAKDGEIIAQELSNVEDDANPISPFPLEIGDLSYSGKELNFEPLINYLKKKLTVALAPSYLIHGDETNYAVSKEQRISLQLKIRAYRSLIAEPLKIELKKIAKSKNLTISDFDIEFGTYDLGQDEENRKAAIEAWNAGLINLNEAREIIGYPKDSDNGEFYSFELKSSNETSGINFNMGSDEPKEENKDVDKEMLNIGMKEKELNLMKK